MHPYVLPCSVANGHHANREPGRAKRPASAGSGGEGAGSEGASPAGSTSEGGGARPHSPPVPPDEAVNQAFGTDYAYMSGYVYVYT